MYGSREGPGEAACMCTVQSPEPCLAACAKDSEISYVQFPLSHRWSPNIDSSETSLIDLFLFTAYYYDFPPVVVMKLGKLIVKETGYCCFLVHYVQLLFVVLRYVFGFLCHFKGCLLLDLNILHSD